MSMHSYPLTESACFFLDETAAMFVLLKHAIDDNALQPKIQELIDKHGMNKVVYDNLIPEEFIDEYQDVQFAMELLIDEVDDIAWAGDFEGEINTKWPEKCEDTEPLSLNIDDNFVLYIRPAKDADFFSQAYSNPEQMCDEFRNKMSDYLPNDFPFWKYIVSLSGTYYC